MSALITASMTPQQRQAYQSIANPGEMTPDYWRFQVPRDSGNAKAYFPAHQQSDNFYALREGYQTIKNGMFNRLVGTEPVYGHCKFPLNPLDQEQTNRPGWEMQKTTRVQDNRDPLRVMRNTPTQYPNYQGKPVYYNYPGRDMVKR